MAEKGLNRIRVVAGVYACAPDEGSEPGVGWNWVNACAKYHEVWAITRSNNREAIENFQSNYPLSNLHFEYIDLPDWAKFWKRGGRGIHLYYLLWQHLLAARALRLHAEKKFHLAHHMTFVSDWMPSGLAVLNIPFVWGPVGHNPKLPRCMNSSKAYTDRSPFWRHVATKSMRSLNFETVATRRRADIVLAINKEVCNEMRTMVSSKTKVLLRAQNAVSLSELAAKHFAVDEPENPFKVLFAGQLISIKGVDLAMDAFVEFAQQGGDAELHFVGAGPMENYIRTRVQECGLERQVFLHGFVSRAKALEHMAKCDVFLFPSAEGAGMVILEAMAKGLPVICLDYGGGGEYVNESCGIKVRCQSRADTVIGLAEALRGLHSNPKQLESLSQGANRRIRQHYTWEQIAEEMRDVYKELSC